MSPANIFQAAREGNVRVLRNLLDGGCPVDHRNSRNATPLMFACLHSRIEAVQLLLSKGASLTKVNEKGLPPLMWAVCGGSVEIVRLLVDQGADVLAVDNLGMTSLHYAACHGFHHVAAFLLDRGAHIEARNGKGGTPLLVSAMGGFVDVFHLLIERRADPTARMNDGKHLLMCAAKGGNLVLFQEVYDLHPDLLSTPTPTGWTVLMNACYSCHPNIVHRILELGTDVNAIVQGGETALMLASSVSTKKLAEEALITSETHVPDRDVMRRKKDLDERRLAVIEILLGRGADKNLRDSNGKRAIDLTWAREVRELLRD